MYIYKYILKKERGLGMGMHSFRLFCIRTLRSLRSLTFFAKERCVLCILLRSLQKKVVFFAFFYLLKKRTQKNAKERIILLGLISRQKLEKRM